uniref:Probable imidazolonepropionase n=1 Tax=Pristionchus pacificus TaxID=54126 RepID=A0A8R1UD27_PRIPA
MLLIKNLRQIVQVVDDSTTEYLIGDAMKNLKILSSPDCTLCIAIDTKTGKISYVGEENGVGILPPDVEVIDGKGGCALPSFVDGHTHPVFAGDRVHEFAMKLAGATYNEVQAAGGGIHFTTDKTREASEESLFRDLEKIITRMVQSGTTTIEAKSGYGLDEDTEMKMLRVLDRASSSLPIEISSTFCGAHAVPRGSTEEKQTQLIVDRVIPRIAEAKKKGELKSVENIDVFCETGNFGVQSTEKILRAGQSIGLAPNFHAEELTYIGGVEMGARIGARGMSHLEEISQEGIISMASAKSAAVLLPSTAFILRLTPPPARKIIDSGVIVALGSDFNPNAHCLSMPMIMSLACITMKLSMEEALVAATINSAYSIGRGSSHGALSSGRQADLLLLSSPRWDNLIYQMGDHSHLINIVIKKGKIVHRKQ